MKERGPRELVELDFEIGSAEGAVDVRLQQEVYLDPCQFEDRTEVPRWIEGDKNSFDVLLQPIAA
jgi:hypothetical protein